MKNLVVLPLPNDTDEENLSDENPPALVIAADTILLSHNAILEKPSNPRHHLNMLRHLRDMKAHKVFTGVVCIAPLEVPNSTWILSTYYC